MTDSDFTVNGKYGWREYEDGGVKYVVIAAATHDMLTSGEKTKGSHVSTRPRMGA